VEPKKNQGMIQCIGLVTHNHTAYQITNQKGILAIKEMEIVGASPIINEFLCPTMVEKKPRSDIS